MDVYAEHGDGTKSSVRRWLWAMLYAVAGYVVLVMAVLGANLSALRALSAGAGLDMAGGPFLLLHIHKTALTAGGFELNVMFQAGLIWLLLICIALSVAVVLVTTKLCRSSA